MKKVLIALLAIITLFGCASRVEPTKYYRDFKYVRLSKSSMLDYMGETFRRVREREPSTKWEVVGANSDAIRVRCSWRSNAFEIDVVLMRDAYNIRYVSSQNLNANDDGSIMYYAYNKLVGYFLEELYDINHGRYTDPLRKSTRSSAFGGDYWNEHNPKNATDVLQSMAKQDLRARNASDGVAISDEISAYCIRCNAEIDKGVNFCPACGEAQHKLCKQCKKVVEGKFCTNCGLRAE